MINCELHEFGRQQFFVVYHFVIERLVMVEVCANKETHVV